MSLPLAGLKSAILNSATCREVVTPDSDRNLLTFRICLLWGNSEYGVIWNGVTSRTAVDLVIIAGGTSDIGIFAFTRGKWECGRNLSVTAQLWQHSHFENQLERQPVNCTLQAFNLWCQVGWSTHNRKFIPALLLSLLLLLFGLDVWRIPG